MVDVLDKVDAWEANGRQLCEELEAERDAIALAIERQRLDVMAINERLRELRSRLGINGDDDRAAERRPRIHMTRAEQRAVPVETVRRAAPAAEQSFMRPIDAVCLAVRRGPGTTADMLTRVRELLPEFNSQAIGAYLNAMARNGEVTKAPYERDPKRNIWTPQAAA